MSNILDTPVYDGFVSPQLCKQLKEQGLSGSAFAYRMHANIAELITYAFDKDDFYLQADENVGYVNNVGRNIIEHLHAWSIKDMEKLIPGNWLLQKNERGYEVMCESIYQLPAQTADRLPDAFAKVVLIGLKTRVLKLAYCNQLIVQTETHQP